MVVLVDQTNSHLVESVSREVALDGSPNHLHLGSNGPELSAPVLAQQPWVQKAPRALWNSAPMDLLHCAKDP